MSFWQKLVRAFFPGQQPTPSPSTLQSAEVNATGPAPRISRLDPELQALLESAMHGGSLEKFALADWLEEYAPDHLKLRGQLVRLQVAIEQLARNRDESSPASLLELQAQYGPVWDEWRRLTLAYNAEHGTPAESPEECWLAAPTIDLPLIGNHTMRFVWVPPGESWLGGDYGQPGDTRFILEKPLWCGIYPVTQLEWEAVMGNNPSYFEDNPTHPVEMVSLNDVRRFLKKLNRNRSRRGYVYRLPTEEEWEYICRGGPMARDDSKYDFIFARSRTDLTPVRNNDLSSEQANFDGNYPAGKAKKGPYLERTSPVGSYVPNPLGIYDMHGNVWDWTSSLYDEYGSRFVHRGGSWFNRGQFCAAANRDWCDPGLRFSRLGFRLFAVPVEG